LPRFHYANYADTLIENAESIHSATKEFLLWRTTKESKCMNDVKQNSYLYSKLKNVKGVGPLSFNQLWHSMCLCGLLPSKYINATTIAPASGPAKLIKTFYPYITKQDALVKKMGEVKAEIRKLGITKISNFFIENMMCEAWRLGNATKLMKGKKTNDERKEVFLSNHFQEHIENAKITRNPDIYYQNPFTNKYQHLFRIVGNDLIMRPSCVVNSVKG
jgi:hypothetical protein